MKRKATCLFLAALLCFSLCACQIKKSTTITVTSADSSTLYAHGMELAGLLEEMLNSPEYLEMAGGSEAVSDVLKPYMGASLSEPESAYLVTLPKDAIPLLMNAAEIDIDEFSGELQDFLERRMISSVPSMFNSQQGAKALAAASILTVSDSWPGEELEAGCYLLLNYPDACPVIVSFCGNYGVVTGTATMLINQPLDEDAPEAISSLFESMGLADIQVEQVEGKDS